MSVCASHAFCPRTLKAAGEPGRPGETMSPAHPEAVHTALCCMSVLFLLLSRSIRCPVSGNMSARVKGRAHLALGSR